MARLIGPFVGRRLDAVWRGAGVEPGTEEVWLRFGPREGDEPALLLLTAHGGRVLPGFVEGGGPTARALRVELAGALPSAGIERWNPFQPQAPADGDALRHWALTALWASPVACNVLSPGGYWLQEVCGGLALHFSNTAGPDFHGRLLGTVCEQHDPDAPHACFCEEYLAPLVGSGVWQCIGRLQDLTRRDDAELRHFDPHDFGGPALAGCARVLDRALLDFVCWFERKPPLHFLLPRASRRWTERQGRVLDKITQLYFYVDLAIRGATDGAQEVKRDMAAFGLGTLFTEAWSKRDGADPADPTDLPSRFRLQEIRRRYAPVREAYRQWFRLFREACGAEQRRRGRWSHEPTPAWILTLDAALSRGTLPFDALPAVPGARVLRDDFRVPWAPFEALDWYVKQGALHAGQPQEVLIEGDEERSDSLRITWWPLAERQDQVIVLRAPAEALQAWWQARPDDDGPSVFEQMLAWRAGRAAQREATQPFAALVARTPLPPGVDLAATELPPYSADDIRHGQWQGMFGHPAADWPQRRERPPELVWTFDSSHRRVPLLIGRGMHPRQTWTADHDAPERVLWPAVWPAAWVGRGPFYLMWSRSAVLDTRSEGLAARPGNWLLPVQRRVPINADAEQGECWRWGLIDIEGRFVLPCRYPAMAFPQVRGGGKPVHPEPPLPAGRREPWCWVWVGKAEHAEGLLPRDRRPGLGDVVEAWSGERINPPNLRVSRLDDQFAVVCRAADVRQAAVAAETGADGGTGTRVDAGADVAYGLCNLASGHCGPIRWRRIDTFCLSIHRAGPAQCAETGRWTYVDDRGEPLLPADLARAGQIDSGLAIVQLGLECAEVLGIALTLADGSRQGPVGVFGPNGVASLGRWFVEPRWREVLGEYDGHFIVQDSAGRWGMVTPEGEAVTRFVPRRDGPDFMGPNGPILQQVIEHFKRVQRRRFSRWLREAAQTGSLALMQNKLRSSFGAYDYGAINVGDIPVRLLRDLPPPDATDTPAADASAAPLRLVAGAEFAWRPGQRNYHGTIDLRTHTMIGPASRDGRGYHTLAVPWDALALVLPEPEFADDADRRRFERLAEAGHRAALDTLLDALDALSEALDGQPDIDATNAINTCSKLSMLLGYLANMLDLPKPGDRREIPLQMMHHDLDTLRWIGDAGSNAEAIRNHPWVQALRPELERVQAAYQAWEPLFIAAVLTDDT